MAQDRPGEVSRKTFLGIVTGGIVAAIGAVVGATGLAYFASPAFKSESEDWVDIGPASAIKHGVPTKVDFTQRRRDAWDVIEQRSSAWVVTSNGADFTAFDPRCTHLGCPYRWDADKKEFLCPCHGGVFNEQGQVVAGPPPRPLDRYFVKVEKGRLLIRPLVKRAIA